VCVVSNRIWNTIDEGVGLIASSTPKACVSVWETVEGSESGFLRLEELLLQLVEGFDLVSEILEVSRIGGASFRMSLEIANLVDKRTEVVQGTNGRERQIVGVAIQAANGTEKESVFDDVERDLASVESCSK
jgi:hypothetical protein